MKKHEWRERTEQGERRSVRAVLKGGRWMLESRLDTEQQWTLHDPPLREDLIELRDVLWRKYQRGRVPHEQVVQLDQMLGFEE